MVAQDIARIRSVKQHAAKCAPPNASGLPFKPPQANTWHGPGHAHDASGAKSKSTMHMSSQLPRHCSSKHPALYPEVAWTGSRKQGDAWKVVTQHSPGVEHRARFSHQPTTSGQICCEVGPRLANDGHVGHNPKYHFGVISARSFKMMARKCSAVSMLGRTHPALVNVRTTSPKHRAKLFDDYARSARKPPPGAILGQLIHAAVGCPAISPTPSQVASEQRSGNVRVCFVRRYRPSNDIRRITHKRESLPPHVREALLARSMCPGTMIHRRTGCQEDRCGNTWPPDVPWYDTPPPAVGGQCTQHVYLVIPMNKPFASSSKVCQVYQACGRNAHPAHSGTQAASMLSKCWSLPSEQYSGGSGIPPRSAKKTTNAEMGRTQMKSGLWPAPPCAPQNCGFCEPDRPKVNHGG